MTRPGEALVRTKIHELDVRIAELDDANQAGHVGPRTYRARLRWLHEDYDKLAALARQWGFEVGA